jgi:hypothetical protein
VPRQANPSYTSVAQPPPPHKAQGQEKEKEKEKDKEKEKETERPQGERPQDLVALAREREESRDIELEKKNSNKKTGAQALEELQALVGRASAEALAGVKAPPPPALKGESANILVCGVGGTGVVTLGAVFFFPLSFTSRLRPHMLVG